MPATKFTAEVREVLVTAISIGASQADASRAARVSDETYRNWLTDGREARAKQEAGGKLTAAEKAKLQFLEDIEAAEAQCAIDMQMIVYNAAQKDPATAQWWLERRRRSEFGPVVRNEIGAPDGGPVVISVVKMPVDAL